MWLCVFIFVTCLISGLHAQKYLCSTVRVCADGSDELCSDFSPVSLTAPTPCPAGYVLYCNDASTATCNDINLPTPKNDDSNSTVIIACVSAAAGVILIVVIVVLLVILLKKKNKDESHTEVQPIGDTVNQSTSSVHRVVEPSEMTEKDCVLTQPHRGGTDPDSAVNDDITTAQRTTSQDGGRSAPAGSLLEDGALMASASIGGFTAEKQAQINGGDYQKVKLIGRGANGAVYSCLLDDGSYVAMKEVFLQEETMRQMVQEVEKEMAVIEEIKHPNVVSYYGAKFVEREQTLLVFMELITGGSLGGMVRNMQEPIRERTAQRYVHRIVEGLVHIHSKGVVHRDLKCDNILMTTEGQVKIADFGTARAIAGGGSISRGAQTMIGTPFFMAPEILLGADESDPEQGAGGYGRSADIWSLGITVAELLNQGNPPWPRFTNPGQAFLHISSDKGIPIVPSHVSADAKDFILQCCIRDPKKRPKADELLDHPWIKTLK